MPARYSMTLSSTYNGNGNIDKLSQLRSQCNLNQGICAIYIKLYIYIYIYIYLSGLPASQKGYGSTWMQEAICEAYTNNVKGSGPDAEFNAYLNSAPQTT